MTVYSLNTISTKEMRTADEVAALSNHVNS